MSLVYPPCGACIALNCNSCVHITDREKFMEIKLKDEIAMLNKAELERENKEMKFNGENFEKEMSDLPELEKEKVILEIEKSLELIKAGMAKDEVIMTQEEHDKQYERNYVADAPKDVNKPSHYNTGKIEVIDFIEDQKLNYHLASALKYICRADHKGTKKKDLQKAIWFITREVKR